MNQNSAHTSFQSMYGCCYERHSRKFVPNSEISLHIYVLALEYYNAPQAKIVLKFTGDTWNQEVRCTVIPETRGEVYG